MKRQLNRARRRVRAPAILKHLLCAAVAGALCFGAARAGTPGRIDFESVSNVVSPTLAAGDTAYNSNDAFRQAGYTLYVRNSASAAADDYGLVGALINGADPFGCLLAACPASNSTYFAGLNDGALELFRDDHLAFTVDGLRFAFIGAPEAAFGRLALTGTLADGGTLSVSNEFPGQVDGVFQFDQFVLGAFSSAVLTSLRIDACLYDGGGGCVFDHMTTQNQAQFAIDNVQLTAVPEPAALTMLLFGLAGITLAARRRGR
ncbi:MAG: NF038120 family PEP-CTERM protein [Telluria sp.]|jgi:hypothetical protein